MININSEFLKIIYFYYLKDDKTFRYQDIKKFQDKTINIGLNFFC